MKRWWLLVVLMLSLGVNVGALFMIAAHRRAPLRWEEPRRPEAQRPGEPGRASSGPTSVSSVGCGLASAEPVDFLIAGGAGQGVGSFRGWARAGRSPFSVAHGLEPRAPSAG